MTAAHLNRRTIMPTGRIEHHAMIASLPLLGEPLRAGHGGGAPLLRKGYRPFFLLAALYAAGLVPIWVLTWTGHASVIPHLDPTLWHGHELIFGFAVAVLAGFLLTAVGNWTGRETAVGRPLLFLVVTWLAGRVAVSVPLGLPPVAVAVIDLAFLPALAFTIARPIIATHNHRNLVMVVVLAALWLANACMHAAALGIAPDLGRRALLAAVHVVVFIIALMAGRIFPMFTRNAARVDSIRNAPQLDRAALVALAAFVFAEAFAPSAVAGVVALVAGVLNVLRARHWGALHSLRHPLLWVLHAGFAFVPIGLFLSAAAAFGVIATPSLATHAFTIGVIGTTTLGMMARVALGHTGRALVASSSATFAFASLVLAAIVRVAGPLVLPSSSYVATIAAAAIFWTAGFAAYAIAYARILFSSRVDGKPG